MKKKLIFIVVIILFVTATTVFAATQTGSISGGGQIHETGGKRPEWNVISFGGWINALAGVYEGEWQVNFHSVGVEAVNKGHFHTTDIRVVNFYEGNSPTCDEALNFTAYGDFNGEPGYKIIFRAGDLGSPNTADTIRVTLYYGSTVMYDSSYGQSGFYEFANESSCVGGNRTLLDAGNITITMP